MTIAKKLELLTRPISDQRAPVRLIAHSEKCGEPQKPFLLFAAIFTWYESDIIESTVKNLYNQGVDTVFLIDNMSPDETIRCAVEAGAVLYDEVYSDKFSDALKAQIITDLINKTCKNSPIERSWWIFCDADELPLAPNYTTIKELIAAQDDEVRVIGGSFINHYPNHPPYNISGFHPADFQFEALNNEDIAIYCQMAHDKHNIIRFDHSGVDIGIMGAFHRFRSNVELLEAEDSVLIHHFNYRNPEHTLPRLSKLALPDENSNSRIGDKDYYNKLRNGINQHMSWYIRRYYLAKRMYTPERNKIFEQQPIPWRLVVQAIKPDCKIHNSRWYTEKELFAVVKKNYNLGEYRVWSLSYAMTNMETERFITYYETYRHSALIFHHIHAIKCYASLCKPEKAFAAIKNAIETMPSISTSKLTTTLKHYLKTNISPSASFDISQFL